MKLGIDFGTTNTVAAFVDRGNYPVVAFEAANSIPSVIAVRSSDEVLKLCERDGIAFIPWGPLAQRAQSSGAANAALAALQDIARERAIDMSQATLAWLLARSPVMLPIPGTSSLEHLEENVAAAGLHFNAAEMRRVG